VVVVFVRVDAAVIVRSSAGVDVLAAYVESPLYAAVIECVPTVQNLVVRTALPALSVGVPSAVALALSLKATVPVAAEGLTAAFKPMLSPVVRVVPATGDVCVSVVVVAVRFVAVTMKLTAVEVLPA
jgi:hypothetical protein